MATFNLPRHEPKREPPKLYRNPVLLAQEWQRRLDSSEVCSRAALARELGVTRAHVTQVLRLLSIAPGTKEAILALGDPMDGLILGAHTLRSIARLPAWEQEQRVAGLIGRNGPP